MFSTNKQEKRVPILMYHSIADDASAKFKPFTVAPALFAEHMAYLHQQDYTPITATQFIQARSQGGSGLPEKPLLLTFDDGFADFFTAALPILTRHGFVATLYIATSYVNATSRWLHREGEATRAMLTWDQIRIISSYGIECGGHSHTHPQLDVLPLEMARHEIVHSKKLLEEQLGQDVTSISYPFGYYSAVTQQLAREAGYTSACAVDYAMSSQESNPFALPRLFVNSDMSVEELATLITRGSTSLMTTLYQHSRARTWRFFRQQLIPMTRYFQRRYA